VRSRCRPRKERTCGLCDCVEWWWSKPTMASECLGRSKRKLCLHFYESGMPTQFLAYDGDAHTISGYIYLHVRHSVTLKSLAQRVYQILTVHPIKSCDLFCWLYNMGVSSPPLPPFSSFHRYGPRADVLTPSVRNQLKLGHCPSQPTDHPMTDRSSIFLRQLYTTTVIKLYF
jgi:hypothetical protein